MSAYTLRAVPAFDIPRDLLEQKDGWNMELWLEESLVASHWHAFLLCDEGAPVAAFVLVNDPMIRAVALQTLIVDQDHRTPEVLGTAFNTAREAAHRLARELGLPRVITSLPATLERKALALLDRPPEGAARRPKPRRIEYVLAEDTWHG